VHQRLHAARSKIARESAVTTTEVEGDREFAADIIEPIDQALGDFAQKKIVLRQNRRGSLAMRSNAATIEDA
jgi:hypothetical protein